MKRQYNEEEIERLERRIDMAENLISYCGRALYEKKYGHLDIATLRMINYYSTYLLQDVDCDEEANV